MSNSKFIYTGQDNLIAMQAAINYNNFLLSLISGRTGRRDLRILDFGSGIGTYANMLRGLGYSNIDCLEIDENQKEMLVKMGYSAYSSVIDLKDSHYDLIYSFNVFEHIENDSEIFEQLIKKLKVGGKIFTYVPAFKLLFSNMDTLVEHKRRYTKKMLTNMKTPDSKIKYINYYDPLGYFAALSYKLMPGGNDGSIRLNQVAFYDRFIFPISKVLHPFTKKLFGKNVASLVERIK